jgi:hypothetical protein
VCRAGAMALMTVGCRDLGRRGHEVPGLTCPGRSGLAGVATAPVTATLISAGWDRRSVSGRMVPLASTGNHAGAHIIHRGSFLPRRASRRAAGSGGS